jgi:hypothetical protein
MAVRLSRKEQRGFDALLAQKKLEIEEALKSNPRETAAKYNTYLNLYETQEKCADILRLRQAVPYRSPETRGVVKNICDEVTTIYRGRMTDIEITQEALNLMANERGTPPKFAQKSTEDIQTLNKEKKKIDLRGAYGQMLVERMNQNSEVLSDRSIRGIAKYHFGISPRQMAQVQQDKTEHRDLCEFYAPTAPGVDFKNICENMEDMSKYTAAEARYAISTFDTNFNGIMHGDEKSAASNNPLDKFKHIYIDGASVSDMCAGALGGLDGDKAKEDYMKCFVTAKALDRQSSIDFVLPGSTTSRPWMTRTDEPQPSRPPLWKRVLQAVRILPKEPLTKQDEYEQRMKNDPDATDRRVDIADKERELRRIEYENSKTPEQREREREQNEFAAHHKELLKKIPQEVEFQYLDDVLYEDLENGVDGVLAYRMAIERGLEQEDIDKWLDDHEDDLDIDPYEEAAQKLEDFRKAQLIRHGIIRDASVGQAKDPAMEDNAKAAPESERGPEMNIFELEGKQAVPGGRERINLHEPQKQVSAPSR